MACWLEGAEGWLSTTTVEGDGVDDKDDAVGFGLTEDDEAGEDADAELVRWIALRDIGMREGVVLVGLLVRLVLVVFLEMSFSTRP